MTALAAPAPTPAATERTHPSLPAGLEPNARINQPIAVQGGFVVRGTSADIPAEDRLYLAVELDGTLSLLAVCPVDPSGAFSCGTIPDLDPAVVDRSTLLVVLADPATQAALSADPAAALADVKVLARRALR